MSSRWKNSHALSKAVTHNESAETPLSHSPISISRHLSLDLLLLQNDEGEDYTLSSEKPSVRFDGHVPLKHLPEKSPHWEARARIYIYDVVLGAAA